ncbi:MAG: DUF2357 domain-containing protein [Gemmiger sp.]|nr:DUF2357 domain-containing protein [Gemmiger sp.]
MANTINDLYLKYVNKVGKVLENDRYFQYLFEMAQNGTNVLQQTNHVLHKVVDERWLSTIEDSLDAINTIIDKPRRFVTTKEEVVPVALARKITAESVRHLSQNTQFIASDANGEIQPTRILNVSSEESYNLYENRFIFTLIQRLIVFIDKRTDVIFWSTGDERTSTLMVQDKVDDAYEEIEYKVEMTIKNKQSYAENDSENMEVFKRIDRVRRLVMSLRQSGFYSLMAGCNLVRSPIQRTNLMMKDPYYRKCYNLWHFLESYDEVGYTIDVKDTALEFDEDYLFQMYTNFINNYVVFKSLLETDHRRIDEAPPKRHKVVRPKFIKQIVEQIVEDYDIPDVEIKKVIIQEVTKAQLLAEKKRAAEEKRKAAAKAKAEAARAKAAEEKRKAAEKKKAEAEKKKAAEKARLAAEKAKQAEEKRLAAEKAKAEAEAARAKAAEEKRLAAEKAKAEAEAAKAKAAEEKRKAAEKAKAAQAAEKAKAAAEKKKAAEKAKAAAAKAKAAEKAKAARAAEKAKAAAAAEKKKAAEKAKAEAAKAKAAEKAKAEAAKAKAAAAKAKAAEKAKAAAEKKKVAEKAKAEAKKPAPRAKKPPVAADVGTGGKQNAGANITQAAGANTSPATDASANVTQATGANTVPAPTTRDAGAGASAGQTTGASAAPADPQPAANTPSTPNSPPEPAAAPEKRPVRLATNVSGWGAQPGVGGRRWVNRTNRR